MSSNFSGRIPSGLGPGYDGDQTYIDANQDAREKFHEDRMKARGYSLTAAR